MNVNQFAQHLGISPVTVYNGLKEGRLPTTAFKDPASGQWDIKAAAFAEWIDTAARDSPVEGRAQVDYDDTVPPQDGETQDTNSKAYSQAKKIMWEAAHAELDYREAAGDLIEVGVLTKQAFALARTFRDSMTQIADGCAARCAAINDEVEVHRIISAKAYEVQKAIVDGILNLVQHYGVPERDPVRVGTTTTSDSEPVGGQAQEISLDQLC